MSLSARRAWIEISGPLNAACIWVVALRKESVDRNCSPYHNRLPSIPSLSARRAWIEILLTGYRLALAHVALRKESVDRNMGLLVAL